MKLEHFDVLPTKRYRRLGFMQMKKFDFVYVKQQIFKSLIDNQPLKDLNLETRLVSPRSIHGKTRMLIYAYLCEKVLSKPC